VHPVVAQCSFGVPPWEASSLASCESLDQLGSCLLLGAPVDRLPDEGGRSRPGGDARDGGTGGGGTGPTATNLHLLPGLSVGDTSLLLYFDAPDTGWASATVRLFADADHGMVLHTASFAFVQAAVCRTPAKFCFTLDNTDGWGLSDGTAYVTTITLTATDGSSTSRPRTAPRPPTRCSRTGRTRPCRSALSSLGGQGRGLQGEDAGQADADLRRERRASL
jgi:hypothetical protein